MSKNNPLTLGKQTWEQLENIHRFGYSYSTTFSDFLDVCLSHLLSLTDNLARKSFEEIKKCKFDGKYEDQYMQIVTKYRENKEREKGNRPADYFANAWGCLLKETHEAEQDILGEIFTTQVSFGEHGWLFRCLLRSSIHAHFQPIPHESASHSIGYEHSPSIGWEQGRGHRHCVTPVCPAAPWPLASRQCQTPR